MVIKARGLNMKDLVYVTSNDGKAREAARLLGVNVQRASLELDELQSLDLARIVEHKARQAYKKLKKPVIVDDVSFEIDQWRGFPGPFAKWLDKTITYEQLPQLLRKENRTARWITMLGFFDGNIFKIFQGVEEGAIALRARGKDGYGFDPIFVRKGDARTVAELGFDIKQKYAARILALRKLKRFLSSYQ